MKLLFDENLSPKLVQRLSDLFPNSRHVDDCGLGSAGDDVIWDFAFEHGFAIVSKDFDFYDRSVLKGAPPKFIWVRTGNCSSLRVESLLRSFAQEIVRFDSSSGEALLILP